MSHRFPPPSSDETSSLGKELEAEMQRGHAHSDKLKYRDQNGAPIGPFAVLVYTPDLFQPYLAFGDAVLNQKDLSPTERELIALAVTAVHELPFVQYANIRIAKGVGMTESQIDSAIKGVEPEGLTDEERVIYTTALELAGLRTPLKDTTWQRAESALGKSRCARLAHVVGLCLYTGTLLKMGAVSAPTN